MEEKEMYFKEDFKSWLEEHQDKKEYAFGIVDPPWSYNDSHRPALITNQLTYKLWNNSDLNLIFEKLSVDYLFLWCTNGMLPEAFQANSCSFVYKTCLTWCKLTSKNHLAFGLGNHFRNCTEQLLLFVRKGAPTLRLSDRTIIFEPKGVRTLKPKVFERHLVEALNAKGLQGVYIFSGGNLDFIDSVDII